jgi:hypothetical protein
MRKYGIAYHCSWVLFLAGFENTVYFRIVNIPFVEQKEVPRYYGKKETRK